jgi:hypothetical protein
MLRLVTVAALLLWLARPSCALCCSGGRPADELRESATAVGLPIADDCCRSNAEDSEPSARTCCLLDEQSDSLTHHPTDTHEPRLEVVAARLLPSVVALRSIPLTHHPSPDLSSTYLKRSILLI